MTPAFPPLDEILARLGPIRKERVLVQDRAFFLLRPEQTEKLHDADYTPFWADIWPASRMLAKVLLHEPASADTHALEIGCGLGLAGIVALSRGLRVTFSDYDPCALYFAGQNARVNGFDSFETLRLDWRFPPEDLRVSLLLGADLIYELSNVEPLLAFIKRVLAPDGLCLMTDEDRLPAHALRQQLEEVGLTYTSEIVRAGEPGGRRLKGTLYRIRHA